MTPEQEARTLWWFHLVFGGAFVGAAVAVVRSGRVTIDLGLAPGDGGENWTEVPKDQWKCFLQWHSTKDAGPRLTEGCVKIGDRLMCPSEVYTARLSRCRRQGMLGSARSGWQAARERSQRTFPGKKFKPGRWDDWTDEELWDKAQSLIMGGKPGDYVFGSGGDGAWFDLDRAYSEATDVDVNCERIYTRAARAVSNIRDAKSIFDTRRIDRFAKVQGRPAIDFPLLEQRVEEVRQAYRRVCRRGPDIPSL